MKQLISKQNLQAIDIERTRIQSIPASAFQNIKKLVAMRLPLTITTINSTAFSGTGLKSIVIPDKVTTIGGDAFAYCNQLATVLVGKNVKSMGQGVFYGSAVKHAYVTPLTPPAVNNYLFSSKPIIHVYPSAVEAYQDSRWAEFGTIVGDLTEDIVDGIEEIYDTEAPAALSSTSEFTPVYDLMGRRVAEMKPGNIYIRNGKKLIFNK